MNDVEKKRTEVAGWKQNDNSDLRSQVLSVWEWAASTWKDWILSKEENEGASFQTIICSCHPHSQFNVHQRFPVKMNTLAGPMRSSVRVCPILSTSSYGPLFQLAKSAICPPTKGPLWFLVASLWNLLPSFLSPLTYTCFHSRLKFYLGKTSSEFHTRSSALPALTDTVVLHLFRWSYN